MPALWVKAKSIFFIIVKNIAVSSKMGECRIAISTIPDEHGSSQVGYITIVDADAIPHRIILPFACTAVLINAIAASPVFIRQAILNDRVGDAAIQIETTAISSTFSGFIAVSNAVLDDNRIGLISPDANRTITHAPHIPTVVGSSTIFNQHIFAIAH